jgi:hypothetical protein
LRRRVATICLALGTVAPALAAGRPDPPGRGVVVHAVRVAGSVSLDGVLAEEVYATAPPMTGFIQQVPRAGEPATEKTDAWVMYDDANLYVAARCWESARPGAWIANEMRRDAAQLGQNDTFGVLLDTFHDRRDGVFFFTNALGALGDQHITEERTANGDWNPVWDVKTARFQGGWTVEMRIPFKSLRYRPGTVQTWGIQLRRVVRRLNEWSYITAVPVSAAGRDGSQGILRVSEAATLVGLDAPPGSKNLEIKPYALSRLTTDHTVSPAVREDLDATGGLDVKYGLTQNLTADFTYHTDFAQVEGDEQQVNLTRFSLVFPEKREFFLEGRGTFDFGRSTGGGPAPSVFFSRRIGLENGRQVPILAGGRVTGKVGEYGIGALAIRTDAEADAPPTTFSVVRVKRDILKRSAVGAIFTQRSHSRIGEGANQVAGLDTKLAFHDDASVSGFVAKSATPGLAGRDTSYQALFDYQADRFGLRAQQLDVGRHFNPEVGFLPRTNFSRSFVEGRYSPRPRRVRRVRQLTFEGGVDYTATSDTGALESRQRLFSFESEFDNSDRLEFDVVDLHERIDEPFELDSDLAILPGRYDFRHAELAYTFGRQRRMSGTLLWRQGSFYNGDIAVLELTSGRVQATPQLSLEPTVSINRIALPSAAATSTVVRLRTSYTFTPRMFVSGLSQYNSSTGRVSTNVRLRWEYRPGSELFVVYTDERDARVVAGLPRSAKHGVVVKINRLFRY